jgi:DNA-binding MarR family transcriptional regulator
VQTSLPRNGPSAAPEAVAERLGELLRALLLDPRADHLGAIEEHGLSVTQVRALLLLSAEPPDELTPGAIAERLGLSPAAISRALDALVRRDLVVRRECREDRRVRRVSLTAAGRRLIDEVMSLRDRGIARHLERVPEPARAQLAAALAAIGPSLAPAPEEAG